jgi:hypothetical protein
LWEVRGSNRELADFPLLIRTLAYTRKGAVEMGFAGIDGVWLGCWDWDWRLKLGLLGLWIDG